MSKMIFTKKSGKVTLPQWQRSLLPPTTSQSSRAPASSGSLSTPRLTRSRRAIQRTEETPGDEGMPSVRPIRSLPARAARSGRRPPMVYPSSPLTPLSVHHDVASGSAVILAKAIVTSPMVVIIAEHFYERWIYSAVSLE